MLKILIVGLGSIGQRHLNSLRATGDFELAALRTFRGTGKNRSDIREFSELDDALQFKPDGVIIANPTALHVSSAIPFLENGSKVLIEKPVAHSAADANRLKNWEPLVRIAYCMRFSPSINEVKYLVNSKLGRVFKASFYRSYYLPYWHPHADYRIEYTARRDLGGGVLRTLSHEIDLMHFFFSQKPINVAGYTDKVSHLEIDTDDIAFFSCKLADGQRINFELDLFSPVSVNRADFYGEKGSVRYDFSGRKISVELYDGTSIQTDIAHDDIDKMYLEQMRDFSRFLLSGKSDNATLAEAVETMNIIEKVDTL